jgi:hypothetical protein
MLQQNGWEQGYNTSYRPLQADVQMKVDPNYTRNLTLGEVGTKNINGTLYREFFLDVNEPAAAVKNWITLDQLEVFISDQANLHSYSAATANSGAGVLSGATKIYDLDNGSDNYVQLDYAFKGSGSGSSDMVFYLADALFTNRSASSFVYLFSQFGDLGLINGPSGDDKNKFESQAGFEEWFTKAIPRPVTSVPEPTLTLLVGSALAGAVWRRRRA